MTRLISPTKSCIKGIFLYFISVTTTGSTTVTQIFSVQFTQSCPTPWDPVNCSMPGLPVHHQLPEFTQTNVESH